jgi:hypothetical protein
MSKHIHILAYISYMRLLEYDYVLITYLTNLLMFCLMLCCNTLEMEKKSNLGPVNDEKNQVKNKDTWQGEITFEVTADNKEDEQRVHIFNRMETEG